MLIYKNTFRLTIITTNALIYISVCCYYFVSQCKVDSS
nr:MAG TPA: hypothetical protein [Caudoviricetes sp.]